jgi:hypothetical protein
VTAGGERQVRLRNAGADYQSQGSRVLHVGLGDAERVDSVEVRWRDGSTQTLEDVRANRLLTVSPAGVVDRQPLPVNGTR